jgi:hypothetical protein
MILDNMPLLSPIPRPIAHVFLPSSAESMALLNVMIGHLVSERQWRMSSKMLWRPSHYRQGAASVERLTMHTAILF